MKFPTQFLNLNTTTDQNTVSQFLLTGTSTSYTLQTEKSTHCFYFCQSFFKKKRSSESGKTHRFIKAFTLDGSTSVLHQKIKVNPEYTWKLQPLTVGSLKSALISRGNKHI